MKNRYSEIQLWEAIKMLDQFNPIKIIYNKQVIYNDYDSKRIIEVLDDGTEVYGEEAPPEFILPKRYPKLTNKLVYSIKLDIVQHHHSIVTIKGEK